MKPSFRFRNSLALLVVTFSAATYASGQSTWNVNAAGNWSTPGNWTGGVPDAAGATANLTFDITAARIVTIDGTSKTVGTLLIGDASHAYTLAAGAGLSLILDNGAADASINTTTTAIASTISAPILLNSGNTAVTNSWISSATTRTLTLSGGISAGTAGTKNITVSGPNEYANVLISGVVSDGGGAVSISKTNLNYLTLSGVNTFSGGVTVAAAGGRLYLNNASALGSGTLTMNGGNIGSTAGAAIVLSTNNAQTWGGDFGFAGTQNLDMGTGAVTLTGNRSIALSGSGAVNTAPVFSVGGGIGGAFSLTTTGANGVAAVMRLAGTNTYTGGTNINGGLVRFVNTAAIPASGEIIIGANGALSVGGAYNTLAGWLGESRLSTTSTGALALQTNSAEAWNPSATGHNTLSLGADVGTGSVTYTGTMTATSTGYYIGGGGGSITFSNQNAMTGANAVTVGNGGGGRTTLSNSNDYTGATSVRSGTTLVLSNGGALGGTGVGAGTTVAAGGGVELTGGITVAGESLTIVGTGATASPTNITSGIASIAGVNTWGGAITANAASNNNVRVSVSTGATLRLTGPVSITGTGSMVLTGGTGGIGEISGDISGTTSTTSIIQNGGGKWTLSGTNTYTGITRIDNGTISVASIATNLGNATSAISLGETTGTGTFIYTGAGDEATARGFVLRSVDTTASVGNGVIDQSGGGTLTINGNITSAATAQSKSLTLQGSTAGNGVIGGVISNSSSGNTRVTKAGTGTWRLNAANTYTGVTTVNGGLLIVGSDTVPAGGINASSGLVVNAGGTFALGKSDVVGNLATLTLAGGTFSTQGFSETLGAVTLSTDSTLALGNGASIFRMASIALTGTLAITGWTGLETGGGTDQVFADSLTADTSRIVFVNPNGITGTFGSTILGTGEIVAVIPEPTVFGLALVAGAGLVLRRRRQA